MFKEFDYLTEEDANKMAYNPWSNDFKVLAEIVGGYHEKCVIGRYLLEVNLYTDGDVQVYAYRLGKFAHRPLKFYLSSRHGNKTYIKIGKLDGEGANLLNRLVKAFNL